MTDRSSVNVTEVTNLNSVPEKSIWGKNAEYFGRGVIEFGTFNSSLGEPELRAIASLGQVSGPAVTQYVHKLELPLLARLEGI
jgi:hypothetical protein